MALQTRAFRLPDGVVDRGLFCHDSPYTDIQILYTGTPGSRSCNGQRSGKIAERLGYKTFVFLHHHGVVSDLSAPNTRVSDSICSKMIRGDNAKSYELLVSIIKAEPLPHQDWLGFMEFCEAHRISGYCYFRLREMGVELPSEVQTCWNRKLFQQAVENQQKVEYLGRLQGELPVPWMLLKGPYLSKRFYGNLQSRHLGDLDLLVREEHLAQARRHLELLGLTCPTRALLPWSATLRFLHALEFRGEQSIDLHRTLRALPWVRFSMERLWTRAMTSILGGRTYVVPADSDSILLHLLGLHDDVGRGEMKLKSVVDLCLMVEEVDADFDWPEFFRERSREGLGLMSRVLLGAVLDFVGLHSKVPRLSKELAREPASLRFRFEEVESEPRWRSRIRWARLFDAPAWIALSWWLFSLPVRWYAHDYE
jgi:hypothetical protein